MPPRRPTSRALAAALGVVLCLPLCLPLGGCREAPRTAEPIVRPVRYQEVVTSGGRRERSFSGTARAGQESQLSFRVAGSVERVSAAVGDRVRHGQEIARLDATDFSLQVQQAEAALAQAVAAQRKAEADYARVRGLYENANAAKSELDAARAQAESTAAQVEAARQQLALARRQLGYARLTAPVEGAIAAVDVEEGENVRAGERAVLLASGSRPQVEVAMPEVLISQVHEGDAVVVTFDALPGVVLPATVTEVGVVATGAGSTFPVTVRLEAEDGSVRSGMAATVTFRFEAGGEDGRIFVPSVAVGEDREGRYVFVLESTGEAEGGAGDEAGDDLVIARRRSVEVGDLTPEGIEILAGLEGGERIATAGVRRLEEGQRVRLLGGDGAAR